MKEFESLRECTFQPNYQTRNLKTERILRSFRESSDVYSEGPSKLYEYGIKWQEEKEQRLMNERQKLN